MNKSTQSGRQEELDKLSEKTEFISENIPKEHPMFQNMRARCGMFGVASMVYALFYTVCLYKNASGITYPFFVAGTLFYFCFCMKKCGVPFKKDVAFYMTSVMLLGISVFLTGDGKIVFLTKWGIFFLMMSFVLHQYYEDNNWNFPKYLLSMCQLAVESLACLEFPFTDMFRCFQKKGEGEKSRALTYTILGLLAGIPMLFIIILLLAGADAVFRNMVITLLDDIKIGNVVGIFLMFFCVCLGSYCLIGALCRHRIPEENSEPRKINPIPAITVMVMLAAVYILFCGIQIFSLFLGKMQLPEGYTWASYAREGFFQLLVVCVINLVTVLVCMWLFREHPLLKAMMTIISGCTYIMIVSSAYRMILYVQNYHLTFLRILVLWTLAVLAVLLAGVIISVYRRSFPLFRYCVVVVTVCYIALAYAKPDARIAEYNLNQAKIRSEGEAVVEDPWFYRNLSVDAVPCILAEDNFSILSEAGPEEECSWKWESYLEKISAMENGGRHFNLSVYRAQKAVERFRNQE